jgi:hypothetical protein
MEKRVPEAAAKLGGASASGGANPEAPQEVAERLAMAPPAAPAAASGAYRDVFVRAAREGLKMEDYGKTWVVSRKGYLNRRLSTTTDKNWATTVRLAFS